MVAYLLDHLADCLPKGLFQSTPYSCTLVLMSRASESACSMDGEGDTELDFEVNIIDGSVSNSPPLRGSSGNPIKCNEPEGCNQPLHAADGETGLRFKSITWLLSTQSIIVSLMHRRWEFPHGVLLPDALQTARIPAQGKKRAKRVRDQEHKEAERAGQRESSQQ